MNAHYPVPVIVRGHVLSWHRAAAVWLLSQPATNSAHAWLEKTLSELPAADKLNEQQDMDFQISPACAVCLYLAMDKSIEEDTSEPYDPIYAMKLQGELANSYYAAAQSAKLEWPDLAVFKNVMQESGWPDDILKSSFADL